MQATFWTPIPSDVPMLDFCAHPVVLRHIVGRTTHRPHRHPHYELVLMTEGRRELVMLDGAPRLQVSHPGDLLIFRPGEGHIERLPDERSACFGLRFREQDLRRLGVAFPATGAVGAVLPLREHRDRFVDVLLRLLEEHARPHRNSARMVDALMVEMVLRLERVVDERVEELGRIAPEDAVELLAAAIRNDPGATADPAAHAARAGITVSELKARFQRRFGSAPQRFQVACRIDRAQELLRADGRPATEIAAELGYDDVCYFYRQFKRRTGMTVAEFRATHPRPDPGRVPVRGP